MRKQHEYGHIDEAPKDGEPIVGVCGGVEMVIFWCEDLPIPAWCYWDEDEGFGGVVKGDVKQWRKLF
jgi:hypothetical protein